MSATKYWLAALAVHVTLAINVATAQEAVPQVLPPPKPTPSRITAATVYRNNALVTRELAVTEGQGTIELVVTPMPPQTVESSLYAEGSSGIRVLSTRYRTRAVPRDTRQEVRNLEAEIQTLTRENEKIQRQLAVADQDLQFLQKLEGFTSVSLQQLTDKSQLEPDSIIKMSKFVMDTRTQQAGAEVTLKQQLQTQTEGIDFATRKLAELTAGASRIEADAVIVIDKTNAEPGTVRLHYLIGAASWKPMYRLRAAGDKDPVQIEYLAAVTQQSGEDWNNINVTLSTSEPALSSAPPDLLPLEMMIPGEDDFAGMAGMGGMGGGGMGGMGAPGLSIEQSAAAQPDDASNPSTHAKQSNAGASINHTAAALQAAELAVDDLALDDSNDAEHAGPSVTYHLTGQFTLPNRHDPQLVEVTRIALEPEFFHKAVPVLSPHVFRLAKLTNKSEYVLLKGEATIYVGTDFVGRQELPLVAIDEPFVAGFGVDPQVQISRRLIKKERAFQGGNQVYTYEFRIGLRNYKSTPVKLQVWDRMPRAKGESAAVNFVSATRPLSTEQSFQRNGQKDGLLRWDLDLPPDTVGDKIQDILYTFKLEYARDLPTPLLSSGGLKEDPIGMGGIGGGMGGMGGGFRSVGH